MKITKFQISYKNKFIGKFEFKPAMVIEYTKTEEQAKEEILKQLKIDFEIIKEQ